MKQPLYLLAFACAAMTGCTTYPQNYTYSPTVAVGGDNQGGIVLPSPYAKAPQPAPITYHEECYDQPRYSSSNYYYEDDGTPIYITSPNVRVKDSDGYFR